MSKKQRSLSRALNMGLLLMAVPIFFISLGTLFIHSRYMIHREAVGGSNSLLNTTLQRVRSYMGVIESSANSNAWMLEENLRPDSMQSVSNRIVRLNAPVISSSVFMVPDFFKEYGHGFSLYTINQGDTVATYVEPEYDYFSKACYTEPVKTGKACWIDPFVEYTEGKVDHNEAIATYCRPIRQPNGRIAGVLTADMSFSRLSKMINDEEHPYPNAYFILLGGDGRYLIHPDTTRLFRKTIYTDADPSKNADIISLGHEMLAGNHGTMHIHLNGALYHVCYQPVPGTDWSLALVCPSGDAMKDIQKLGYIIILLIIVGLLLIVWLSSHVVRQITNPITDLLDSTQQIVDGKYDEMIPTTRRKGMLGRLQNSFVKMQQSLNERMSHLRENAAEIRENNDALEKARVQADATVKRKNLFIQHVTQQMRMPLNVIIGFANVLRESSNGKAPIDKEELSSIASMMKSNAVDMNRMVLMLFDASETDASEALLCKRVDEVSVNEVARECIKYTYSYFPNAYIHFETELDDALCILTNHLYLVRTLRELLYNAAKYTDGMHINLMVSQTDTTVRFTVQDVGPGLPAGSLTQIFKLFSKTGDLSEGLGLGLPLAKRHALSLGGDLIYDARYHKGCRLVLELPK